jgi:hypothetical protein
MISIIKTPMISKNKKTSRTTSKNIIPSHVAAKNRQMQRNIISGDKTSKLSENAHFKSLLKAGQQQ